jgi:hypothetical protein
MAHYRMPPEQRHINAQARILVMLKDNAPHGVHFTYLCNGSPNVGKNRQLVRGALDELIQQGLVLATPCIWRNKQSQRYSLSEAGTAKMNSLPPAEQQADVIRDIHLQLAAAKSNLDEMQIRLAQEQAKTAELQVQLAKAHFRIQTLQEKLGMGENPEQ